MANKPTLIKPDGTSAGMRPEQLECIKLLEDALDSAKKGEIWSCVFIAAGPNDFGSAMAGPDAARLNLGLDAAKQIIMDRVTNKRSVLHR